MKKQSNGGGKTAVIADLRLGRGRGTADFAGERERGGEDDGGGGSTGSAAGGAGGGGGSVSCSGSVSTNII